MKRSTARSTAKTVIVLLGASAFATPVAPAKADFNSACAGATSSGALRSQQCQAAQSAQQGAGLSGALTKVWTSVATVCTAQCIASGGGASEMATVCKQVVVKGNAVMGMLDKNYAAGLSAIGNPGGHPTGTQANPETNNSTSGGSNTGHGMTSCLSAVAATVQAYQHQSNQQQDNQAYNASVNAAEQGLSGAPAPGAPVQFANNAGTGPGSLNSISAPNTCASTSGNAAATLQCAIANDSNLPSFVNTAAFAKDFQHTTGVSLPDFLASKANLSPAAAIAGGVSHVAGEAASSGVASVLQDVGNSVSSALAQAHPLPQVGGSYTSGAGLPATGDSGQENSLTDLVSGLAEKLGKQGDEPSSGLRAVVFANRSRTPASIVEDKTLSLFDRITYRYALLGKALLSAEEPRQRTPQ